MRVYSFQIDARQRDIIFSPIRSRTHACIVLLECMKLILINEVLEDRFVAGEFELIVGKMSRVVFRVEGKIFSISFPFTVRETGPNQLGVYWRNDVSVDSGMISLLRGFIGNNQKIEEIGLDDFYEKASEINEINDIFWELLKVLMFYEEGYFRYECDPARANGVLHPLHHFDLFYRNSNAIKIGLHEEIDHGAVIDIFNSATDCYFLKKG